MKRRVTLIALFVVLAYGCASTAPPPQQEPEALHGVASWYGEEFAGRTTANGEIFDPALLTAAHRTFPFGTILEVKNPKTQQSVWVRVNDRGPYIANRVIDLSYAAAQKISLIEPGVGEVDIKIVKVGSGEREPPAAFDVTIAEAPKVAPQVIPAQAPVPAPASVSNDVPAVAFPLPVKEEPVVVDRVIVETQHGDVVTRKQVGPDGKTIEDVPTGEIRPVVPKPAPAATASTNPGANPRPPARAGKQYVVQVGAFSIEENARSLEQRLTSIGQHAWIDRADLFRVRIGPFATRALAAEARQSLEENGLSAIILAE
jgi:peptidoglycan lytic transglycosylase